MKGSQSDMENKKSVEMNTSDSYRIFDANVIRNSPLGVRTSYTAPFHAVHPLTPPSPLSNVRGVLLFL